RRHTRSDRDWSSDVCSSDLWHYRAVSWVLPPAAAASVRARTPASGAEDGSSARGARILVRRAVGDGAPPIGRIFLRWDALDGDEIGRASCRERVWSWRGGVD